ncbi:hypothetical protein F5887DRAFT_1078963 [Amanita rubescens]|nr:hypothetical protein F5887DRAFT_1078963 [Amanita rubescens]
MLFASPSRAIRLHNIVKLLAPRDWVGVWTLFKTIVSDTLCNLVHSLLGFTTIHPHEPAEEAQILRSQLQLAYNAVSKLKETFSYVESEVNPEGASVPNDDFDQRVLEIVLAIFEARMKVPQLNIAFADSISLKSKSDLNQRIATTSSLKEDDLWSSNNLYRQLNLLESLIARNTEAGARAWIDAFFFRAAAILPSDKRMILTMEYAVPSVNIVANEKDARIFQVDSRLSTIKRNMRDSTCLFVVEAKRHDPANHVPQAVAELFACAKYLDKQVVRGALTNGSSLS